jgi:hypothetical protein
MHLEFHHPEYRTAIITSPIEEIQERPQLRASLKTTAEGLSNALSIDAVPGL